MKLARGAIATYRESSCMVSVAENADGVAQKVVLLFVASDNWMETDQVPRCLFQVNCVYLEIITAIMMWLVETEPEQR